MIKHDGKCPCGCGKEVPSGKFWATDACGKKGRRRGIRMPVTYHRKHERILSKHGTRSAQCFSARS